jgi:hypothetical protein
MHAGTELIAPNRMLNKSAGLFCSFGLFGLSGLFA